jgi:hypothetical protein
LSPKSVGPPSFERWDGVSKFASKQARGLLNHRHMGNASCEPSTDMNWLFFLWLRQSWMPVERLVADLKTGIYPLKSTGAECASHLLRGG